MNPPNLLFKIAAVCSSLLLVGGCISHRVGAFKSFWEVTIPAAEEANTAAQKQNGKNTANPGVAFIPAGADSKSAAPAIWTGTKAPIRNDSFTLELPKLKSP